MGRLFWKILLTIWVAMAAIGLARQNPERLEAMFDRLDGEVGRMDILVGEILTLARLDSGVHGEMTETFDVVALLEAVLDDARIEAEARECRLTYRGGGRADRHGQPDWLGRAFENVIRNAIFEPIYRGRQPAEMAGFGLGLAIARRAVTTHGGRMRARNRRGGGLCVEIELPAEPMRN